MSDQTPNDVFRNRCTSLTDAGVARLGAAGGADLHVLSVASCSKLTDAAVERIAATCPALRTLNLNFCKEITDAGVRAVAEKCPELRKLCVAPPCLLSFLCCTLNLV